MRVLFTGGIFNNNKNNSIKLYDTKKNMKTLYYKEDKKILGKKLRN